MLLVFVWSKLQHSDPLLPKKDQRAKQGAEPHEFHDLKTELKMLLSPINKVSFQDCNVEFLFFEALSSPTGRNTSARSTHFIICLPKHHACPASQMCLFINKGTTEPSIAYDKCVAIHKSTCSFWQSKPRLLNIPFSLNPPLPLESGAWWQSLFGNLHFLFSGWHNGSLGLLPRGDFSYVERKRVISSPMWPWFTCVPPPYYLNLLFSERNWETARWMHPMGGEGC